MRRALALLLLPAAAGAVELRVAAGYVTGRWRPDDVLRGYCPIDAPDGTECVFLEGPAHRLDGAQLSVEWLPGAWRLSAGYRVLNDSAEEVTLHYGTLLAGYDHPWFHAALGGGIGYLGRTCDDAVPGRCSYDGPYPLPAGRLRLGPREWVYLDASLLDLTPWSPGPGLLRLGIGGQPFRTRLWLGWAFDTGGSGLGAAADIPISEALRFNIGAGVDPRTPGDWLMLTAGLSFDLEPEPWTEPEHEKREEPPPTSQPLPPPSPHRQW